MGASGHAQVDLPYVVILAELGHRPVTRHMAMLQHIGAVGDAQRRQSVLLGHQNRHAAVANLPNGIKDFVLEPVSDTDRGLVQQQQFGCAHQSAANCHHLLLPAWRLPLAHALSFMHGEDKRPVFVFPWEGATVIGTTDLDHAESLNQDARISAAEVDYLLTACAQQFPAAQIGRADVLSSWAGVRPVVADGQPATAGKKPSDEKREHALWVEPGCVTLAGGKLTTFRLLALEVLQACAGFVGRPVEDAGSAVFTTLPALPLPGLSTAQQRRLAGRYGRALPQVAELLTQLGQETVGATETLWAELAFAAEHELVLHLDDLLLRRTRLGLLLAHGAAAELPRIRQLCQARLGWDDPRWTREQQNYLDLWQRCYSLPADPAMRTPA